MSIEASGPVSVVEVQDIVAQLSHMSSRACEHGQQMFYFVLSMAAESLADNVENAADMESDDAAHID